ncbi:reverse transcriptase domain-containing protein [Tanacetum coccineum]
MEHQLKIYPLAEPVVHKRRPMTPDERLVLKEKVFRWLKEGLIRKDMYPFPEEGEELASIMGYPYKCFLRLPKEYNQIRMAEDDEEKTGFHTEEGVYCFTHMPRELKNSAATLQRMMEKDLVQGLEETLRKLKRVNIKIDPITSSFGVKEGRFLGHMVTREGLTAISKFIPKLAELKYPIRKVKVVIDGPIEEILKLFGREGRLAKWAAEVWTYDISYIQRKEAEESVVKKFFGQGEQVQKIPDANEGGTFNLSKKLQAKSTPTPRAWRLYMGKEIIEEGLGVGIILVSPDEKMHSYVIRLKFNTSDHAIDCEALLAGLAASISKGMKDLHVFMDSLKLVAQIEGNHTPTMEQEKRVSNRKVGIYKLGSIGRYQNKTIGGGDKQQQEGKSGKGEAIRLRVGGMTQDPLDGQEHIYSQFASSSEQQVSIGIPRAPPLTENGLTNRREKLNLNLEGLAAASSSTMEEGDDIK